MPRFGLVGPTYQSQSPLLDAQLTMNWYPELDESGAGNSPLAMYPSPGLKTFCDMNPLAHTSVRGDSTIVGRTFAIEGPNFNEVFSNGTFETWGQVENDGLVVSFAASPQQMLIGSAGAAYVFDLGTNTLTQIPAATFAGPVANVGICDDFFLVRIAASKEFYVSGVLDAFDWISNGPAIVSVFPNNLVGMLVDHREIWFWSDTKSVVYYDSGNIFPFDVIPSAFIEAGLAASASPVQLFNTVFWLGSDERGTGVVFQANGYTPQRVSNHAVEFAIQSYLENGGSIANAIGFPYQEGGHQFYVLYFPTPSVTWVYDVLTGMWHQRGYWLTSIGQFRAARYQCHTFNFGRHLVGDYQSGKIYEMRIPYQTPGGAWNFADDDGNPIRRVRRAPHISKEQKRQYFNELQVLVEAGLGPQPPLLKNYGNLSALAAQTGSSVAGSGEPWANPGNIASNTPGTYASVELNAPVATPEIIPGTDFGTSIGTNTMQTTLMVGGTALLAGDTVVLAMSQDAVSGTVPIPASISDPQGNVWTRLVPDQILAPFQSDFFGSVSIWSTQLKAGVSAHGSLVITTTMNHNLTAGNSSTFVLRSVGALLGYVQGTGGLSPDQPVSGSALVTTVASIVVAIEGGLYNGPVNSSGQPSGFTLIGQGNGESGNAIAAQVADSAGSFTDQWSMQINGTSVPWGTTLFALAQEEPQPESQLLEATDFGFAIPSGATILGVQVQINGKQTAQTTICGLAPITGPTTYPFRLPVSDGNSGLLGGPGQFLGLTGLTPAIVNASGFGFYIQAEEVTSNTETVDVSGVVCGIWYTPPGVTVAMLARGPAMMLRWSNDSAKTWSNIYSRDCGQAGENQKRVRWFPLGEARDRIFEISCTDPIGWRVIDAYLDWDDGTN